MVLKWFGVVWCVLGWFGVFPRSLVLHVKILVSVAYLLGQVIISLLAISKTLRKLAHAIYR